MRVRAFESLPGSQFESQQRRKLIRNSRSGEGYGYFSWKETYRVRMFPPQSCEVIQLARITGSDPVHARSNRALAAKFRKWSQSLAAGQPNVFPEGPGQIPLRLPPRGGRDRKGAPLQKQLQH